MNEDVVVHPGTGEVLERLGEQPAETLAEALDAVRARQTRLKWWGDALEGELRQRLKIQGDRTFAQFGDWEVRAETERSRVWDADELEGILGHLRDDGIIQAAEAAGVIERKSTVAGRAALALRGRLGPDAQAAIDRAWTWKERRKPLEVIRSVQLVQAGDPQQHEQQHQKQDHVNQQIQRVGSHHPATYPDLDPEDLFA